MIQRPLENVLAKSLTQTTSRLQCLLMRSLPYDFNVRSIKGLLISFQATCQGWDHYRTKSSFLSPMFIKQPVVYKPQWAEFNCCVRPLHKTMTCVYVNKLCKLAGQAKYKCHPWRNLNWRWFPTPRDKSHCTHKLKKRLLKQIHVGHLKLSKCVQREKLIVYWPGL